MIVLRANIAYLRAIGLFLNANQQAVTIVDYTFNIVFTISLISTIVGVFAYLIVHITDVNKATEAAYVICALCQMLIIYWILALKRLHSRRMIDELQHIVQQSGH